MWTSSSPSGAPKPNVSEADRVFDASAVLAILYGEPGGEQAVEMLPALISAVNAAEVLAKLIQKGMPYQGAIAALEALDLSIRPFGAEECRLSAKFTDPRLSLGDRSCLATASKMGAHAITADRAWKRMELNLKLTVIR